MTPEPMTPAQEVEFIRAVFHRHRCRCGNYHVGHRTMTAERFQSVLDRVHDRSDRSG